MKIAHIHILSLLLAAVFLTYSCEDILGVRDPQPPDRPTESHWVPPTSPELVIANMESAFAYREYETYIKCLSDTGQYNLPLYRFIPSVVTSIRYPGKFDVWGLNEEQVWFQSVLASCPGDSLLRLKITDDEPFVELLDTVEYQFSYTINLHHIRQGPPVLYEGKGIFRMVRDARNYWVIYRWDDISTDHADWTDLKALF